MKKISPKVEFPNMLGEYTVTAKFWHALESYVEAERQKAKEEVLNEVTKMELPLKHCKICPRDGEQAWQDARDLLEHEKDIILNKFQ